MGKDIIKIGNLDFEIRNGQGYSKEYDSENGKLIFEGEYLNGERNGKGKEYYFDGSLRFEGEYSEGKIWNGKGYDKKDNLQYEIKNGLGHTKEYNFYGDLIFVGEYLNGERNGKGEEYGEDSFRERKKILRFKGEYLNGKKMEKEKNLISLRK